MRRRWLASLVGVALLAGAVGGAVRAAPPPGATAQCADGTYSFSQHHSGTCSHHGGVAVSLDGSTATVSATVSGTNTSTTAATTSTPPVDVGKTVLLAPQTKTSGCKLGALTDRRCSPGEDHSSRA